MTRLVRWRDLRPVMWKNGGGTTREIWREPADGESYDWRASVAEVAEPGPFSMFPGYDRIIMPLSAHGMRLIQDGVLFQALEPLVSFSFPGELLLAAELPSGAVTDFNLITRRGTAPSTLDMHRLTETETFNPPAGTRLIFVVSGSFRWLGEPLDERDSLVLESGESISLAGTGTLACCRF